MRDISLSGMFVVTDERKPPLDTPLFVTFNLATAKHLGDFGIEAMVVRHTAFGVGLMFLDMAVEAVRTLRAALYGEWKPANKPPIALALA